MTAKERENQKDAPKTKSKKIAAAKEIAQAEDLASEINARRWSVVTFEKCVAGNLTYEQAVEKIKKLAAEKVAGLCIVTDEAAQRIKN